MICCHSHIAAVQSKSYQAKCCNTYVLETVFYTTGYMQNCVTFYVLLRGYPFFPYYNGRLQQQNKRRKEHLFYIHYENTLTVITALQQTKFKIWFVAERYSICSVKNAIIKQIPFCYI